MKPIGLFLHLRREHQPDHREHEFRPQPAESRPHLFEFFRDRNILGTGLYTLPAVPAERCIGGRTHPPHQVHAIKPPGHHAVQAHMVIVVQGETLGNVHPGRAGHAIGAAGAPYLDQLPVSRCNLLHRCEFPGCHGAGQGIFAGLDVLGNVYSSFIPESTTVTSGWFQTQRSAHSAADRFVPASRYTRSTSSGSFPASIPPRSGSMTMTAIFFEAA